MIFTKEVWEKALEGYLIVGCAIRNCNRQIYLLVEDTGDKDIGFDYYPRTRFLFTYNDETDPLERYFYLDSGEYDIAKIAYNPNGNETIAVDLDGHIYSHTAGNDRDEIDHPYALKDTELVAVPSNIATIGESMYTVSIPHRLHKRIGINQWQDLSQNLPLPEGFIKEKDTTYGWDDLDGFSETDMYMVGGEGDVWHYDGKKIRQCDFPSNELVENVCCAGDGYVYIGGNNGRLWRGKKDSWQLLSKHEFVMAWKNIAWFKGRLFLGSDYGLWEWIDNKVVSAQVPAQVKNCSGAISVSADKSLLLTAGQNGASLFDGEKWEVLFDGLAINRAYTQ